MDRIVWAALCCFLLVLSPLPSRAQSLQLVIDADYSHNRDAAAAIELGVTAALTEASFKVGDLTLEIVAHDHRANAKRSLRTMMRFLDSGNAIAVIGGMHSQPYLANRDFINRHEVLLLLPWSAAAPITRASFDGENWIFRLSVDDAKSGQFLVSQALRSGCGKISLLLQNDGWGRTNFEVLRRALESRSMPVSSHFFPFGIGRATARDLANKLGEEGTDCVILISNPRHGAVIAHALHEKETAIRLFSHWGITGGGFPDSVPDSVRTALDISVLQTCGLRRDRLGDPVLSNALQLVLPQARSLSDMPAPAGFVHGYDLTKVLLRAIEQASAGMPWATSPIEEKRRAVKRALENLDKPVLGILQIYNRPFSEYRATKPDAHEALGASDLCLARFRSDGRLVDAD
ncbi:MAG: ABC transporter substrate-binding protein [Pseudomonadota bacterium]